MRGTVGDLVLGMFDRIRRFTEMVDTLPDLLAEHAFGEVKETLKELRALTDRLETDKSDLEKLPPSVLDDILGVLVRKPFLKDGVWACGECGYWHRALERLDHAHDCQYKEVADVVARLNQRAALVRSTKV